MIELLILLSYTGFSDPLQPFSHSVVRRAGGEARTAGHLVTRRAAANRPNPSFHPLFRTGCASRPGSRERPDGEARGKTRAFACKHLRRSAPSEPIAQSPGRRFRGARGRPSPPPAPAGNLPRRHERSAHRRAPEPVLGLGPPRRSERGGPTRPRTGSTTPRPTPPAFPISSFPLSPPPFLPFSGTGAGTRTSPPRGSGGGR